MKLEVSASEVIERNWNLWLFSLVAFEREISYEARGIQYMHSI